MNNFATEIIFDMEKEEKFRKLIAKAKEFARSDSTAEELQKGLAYYKKAFEIHQTDKLNQRIKKLEAYLKEVDESDEEGGEEMAHVGEGFYLYKELYNKIYAHQREGVLFLWRLWRMKKGGILGDDMGLGKTIQVCAFLAGMFDSERIKSVLIVVPVAVMINWVNEFQKWAPGIDVHDYHDQSKKGREKVLMTIQRHGGVCLTSYGIVVNNADTLSTCNGRSFVWDYVILDEGHKIKNPSTKSAKGVHMIPAKNRIVLSGTPLMNNLKELWSLYDWTHAGQLLGSAKTFAMEYGGPIARAREKDATAGEQRLGIEMSKSLQDMIAPYFLRRCKSDVVNKEKKRDDQTAPDMPTLTRKNDLICWVYLSEIQKKIYRDFIETPDVRELLDSKRSPLVALTVLKKICDHPRVMTNRQCEQLGLTVDQRINLDELDARVAEDTGHFAVDHIPDEMLIQESGKMVFLIELLDNLKQENHRCLIFSQSRKVLNIIQKIVQNRGHKICRLDGSIRLLEERQKIINRFIHDKSYSIFLLTTQVGGVGLTLTAADRVVIYDPSWNPATDSQAVDRAFRIGQEKNVVVYRLITCGSIEEKIYRRQIFKDSINRMTTGDTKNPFRYFTKQELRELFALSDTSSSVTQQQLAKLQHRMRKSDTELDAHLAFLYSLEMFGISDHDLMFEVQAKEIEGEADVDDEDSQKYVQSRALKARETLTTESEATMELVKKLGKYPGPQSDDITKLFPSVRPSAGSRKNFPKPGPSFSSSDFTEDSSELFIPSMPYNFRERNMEENMKSLYLEEDEPRSPTPPPSESSYSSQTDSSPSKGGANGSPTPQPLGSRYSSRSSSPSQSGASDAELSGSPTETSPAVLISEAKANDAVSPKQSLVYHVTKPDIPYGVIKESIVFSPVSSKPLVSMGVADEEQDDLYLAEKFTLSEESPLISRARGRRSSMMKRRESWKHYSPSEVFGDSPIIKSKKLKGVILSDEEEEEKTDPGTSMKQEFEAAECTESEEDDVVIVSERTFDENRKHISEKGKLRSLENNQGEVGQDIGKGERSHDHVEHDENADYGDDDAEMENEEASGTEDEKEYKDDTTDEDKIIAKINSDLYVNAEGAAGGMPGALCEIEPSVDHVKGERSDDHIEHGKGKPSDDVEHDDEEDYGDSDDAEMEDEETDEEATDEDDEYKDTSDEDEFEQEFTALVSNGQQAYKNKEFTTALECLKQAKALVGENEMLDKWIEKVNNHLVNQ